MRARTAIECASHGETRRQAGSSPDMRTSSRPIARSGSSGRWRTVALGLILAAAVPTGARAQQVPERLGNFHAAAFDSVARIAQWLAQYDAVAWWTSDSLMAQIDALSEADRARLGPDWFAYEQDATWHAVYGRYHPATHTYDAVFHFGVDSLGRITRLTTPVDSALGARYGRMLSESREHLAGHVPDGLRFNGYVRPLPDGATDVWYVPAFQPNGVMVFGAELRFGFDSAGRLIDSTIAIDTLKGIRPDTTYTLNLLNEANEVPTVGKTLFLLLYRRYFGRIVIWNRAYTTSMLRHGNQEAWVHAARGDRADTSAVRPP